MFAALLLVALLLGLLIVDARRQAPGWRQNVVLWVCAILVVTVLVLLYLAPIPAHRASL